MLARHKIDTLLDRFAEIEHMMSSNPDPSAYVKLSREYAGLEPLACTHWNTSQNIQERSRNVKSA